MKIIVEGSEKDIKILLQENRIRVGRGLLRFSDFIDEKLVLEETEPEKPAVAPTPKAKVKATPKA